jgi:signal peptidase I
MWSEAENVLMPKGNMATQTAADLKLGLAAEILRSGYPIHLRALGTSMLPSIWPGDLLTIESCDPPEIAVGDIIRFMQAGRFVIHRVIGIGSAGKKFYWLTRGDSLACEDAPVSQDQFLGKVTGIRRNGSLICPTRQLSALAQCFGRMLAHVSHIQGAVLRIRAFLRRRLAVKSDLANI